MQLKRGGLNIGICTCGAQLEMVQLERIEGSSEGVTVSFDGLSCLECPEGGHLRLYPYWAYSEEEFYENIIGWVTEVVAPKSGASGSPKHSKEVKSWLGLRTAYACDKCSARLDASSARNQTLSGHVEPEAISPIDISVEIPFVTCPSCQQTQIYGDPTAKDSLLIDKLKQAILDALQNAQMQP